MSFLDFKLDQRIMDQIEALKFETPTPIQKEAIPVVLKGRDVMGLAQTGTGKTAAFALPMLQKLMNKADRKHVRGLIIAPTRELAEQINDAVNLLGKYTKIIFRKFLKIIINK